jgi:DNA-binding beta-propeller fold protein YncE
MAKLLVVNQGDSTMSIVDPETCEQVAKIPQTEICGHEVIASPDGKLAYVPIYSNVGVGEPGTNGRIIEIIDLQKRQRVDIMDLGRPVRPHCALFGQDGLLYVTAELDNAVDVIDPHHRRITGTLPTGKTQSHMMVMSHDGRRSYTSNIESGTVTAIDLGSRRQIAVIPVSRMIQRISISADDGFVFTADQLHPRVAMIDTRTNEVVRWIEMPGVGYGTTPTPDGRWLLVTLRDTAQVGVIDLSSMRFAGTFDVASKPMEILVRPDGELAYVSCMTAGSVAELDLKTLRTMRIFPTGPGADGLAWAAGV